MIDGAENCAYSFLQFTDAEFALIFPASGQDIEFIKDILARDKANAAGDALRKSRDCTKHSMAKYQPARKQER